MIMGRRRRREVMKIWRLVMMRLRRSHLIKMESIVNLTKTMGLKKKRKKKMVTMVQLRVRRTKTITERMIQRGEDLGTVKIGRFGSDNSPAR